MLVVPAQLTLQAGQRGQLASQANDRAARPIGGAEIRYAAADTALLHVTSAGLITAIGRAPSDTAVIVTSGDKERRVPVHVLPGPPARLRLAPIEVGAKGAATIIVRVEDEFGNGVPGVSLEVRRDGSERPERIQANDQGDAAVSMPAAEGEANPRVIEAQVSDAPSVRARFTVPGAAGEVGQGSATASGPRPPGPPRP